MKFSTRACEKWAEKNEVFYRKYLQKVNREFSGMLNFFFFFVIAKEIIMCLEYKIVKI